MTQGPLSDVKIVEMAGQGPAPFAGALLADFGADVVVIDRPATDGQTPDIPRRFDFYMRNKRSISLDLKSDKGRLDALALIGKADVLTNPRCPTVVTVQTGLACVTLWRAASKPARGRNGKRICPAKRPALPRFSVSTTPGRIRI